MFKIILFSIVLFISGCSTQGHFIIPEGSELYLGGRSEPEKIQENGIVHTRAFGLSQLGIYPAKGILYKLENDGEVIKEGKLRTKFRAASLLIPYVGIFAFPTGLNPDIVYDLENDTQE